MRNKFGSDPTAWQDFLQSTAVQIPLGKLSTVEGIAKMVVYLSDKDDFNFCQKKWSFRRNGGTSNDCLPYETFNNIFLICLF